MGQDMRFTPFYGNTFKLQSYFVSFQKYHLFLVQNFYRNAASEADMTHPGTSCGEAKLILLNIAVLTSNSGASAATRRVPRSAAV